MVEWGQKDAAFSPPSVLSLRLDVSTKQYGVDSRNLTSTVFAKRSEVTSSYTECNKETREYFLLYLFWCKLFYLNPEGLSSWYAEFIRGRHLSKEFKTQYGLFLKVKQHQWVSSLFVLKEFVELRRIKDIFRVTQYSWEKNKYLLQSCFRCIVQLYGAS